ncbi:putative amino acid racemase [Kineothrix alysoides]|uniref:Putative amino acid racemase n=1 Tax=Kineothrix alysoides TaxID=1469948 RepID=A0A4V2QCF9_9FIRM|nr:alanine racemase [Kineothrix alysoides]TCL60117.1 putative amino acid racemase [Kineothrix alysoides]
MFLDDLELRNPKLIEYSFKMHQSGKINPNTYILDLDTILNNSKELITEAKKYDIEPYFMSKQLGRNPLVCKKLMGLGFKGAVVVDFQEAKIMIDNNIPIAHIGNLVQIPDGMLKKVISYGVGMITIFSLEKARKIDEIARQLGITQNICLKFYNKKDFLYDGQKSGFLLEDLEYVLAEILKLKNLKIDSLTAFPCYLYEQKSDKVLPTANLKTMQSAQKRIHKLFNFEPRLNVPSCNQANLMYQVSLQGGSSVEPGSSLMGMTPDNVNHTSREIAAMVYVTEVSHNFQEHAFCYGGGSYFRGKIDKALVGTDKDASRKISVIKPAPQNIDYHIELSEQSEVGKTVLMAFRTQVFVTRSEVAVISGLQQDKPKIEGFYTSGGQFISEKSWADL